MGSGIAQITASAKMNVFVVDSNAEALNKAQKSIEKSLQRVAKKRHADDSAAQAKLVAETLSRVKTSTKVSDAVRDADLVIEAIVENIDAKKKLFAEIEKAARSDAILASNTSSLRLMDIAVDLKNKPRFVGLHFFNPAPIMQLLEVIRHPLTSEKTFEEMLDYGKEIGKVTVKCKDTPGFIVNRLLIPYMMEALRLYERGDASKEDIDVAMKLGAGYKMGPFELADYVGLDTVQFIIEGWSKTYPEEPAFRQSRLLQELVCAGKLGRKSGEGFYKY
ncbi:unnamed protein product [Caenorhabditis auriculariae]|uniref:3-hydroxyacyl-CoA dehydrogenase n=1 Tax=Caenorhabditis auriculariae TaxID=2777116 RepID=A0A8S1GWB2_9PELO|nr:unnamed protein product [Caenorhabditis auriculariae]